MGRMTSETHLQPHSTTAYCPWANRTIERLCEEVLRASWALLAEWRLIASDWSCIVPCTQNILCQSPLQRLETKANGTHRTPLECFTSLRPTTLITRPLTLLKFEHYFAVSDSKAKVLIRLNEVQEALKLVHEDVSNLQKRSRKKGILLHNAHTNIIPIKFSIGDYVMGRKTGRRSHKIDPKWHGPMCLVITINHAVFELESLADNQWETAHAQHFILCPPMRSKQPSTQQIVKQAQHLKQVYHAVERFEDNQETGDKYE